MLIYMTITMVGILCRSIGASAHIFNLILFGRLLEGAGYEVAIALIDVFVCVWCPKRLAFSMAIRHCFCQAGFLLPSMALPILYNLKQSVQLCFWVSTVILTVCFGMVCLLIMMDSMLEKLYEMENPDQENSVSSKGNLLIDTMKNSLFLPTNVWIIILIGSILNGLNQSFTVFLSACVQRLFYYTNQEGGVVIVFFYKIIPY